MLSAQLVTQTRLCAAQYCPYDAEPRTNLCSQHLRLQAAGVEITLHQVTQPVKQDAATHLWCADCQTWKVDADFPMCNRTGQRRRHRHRECRECISNRRRQRRLDPTVREHEANLARTRAALRRARINGEPRP